MVRERPRPVYGPVPGAVPGWSVATPSPVDVAPLFLTALRVRAGRLAVPGPAATGCRRSTRGGRRRGRAPDVSSAAVVGRLVHRICGWTRAVGPATGGSAQVTRTGDAGRLVDELSPAMCTGWGDLGSSAHPPSRPLGVATASHDSGDRARHQPELRVLPVGVECRPGAAPRLGTDWGRAWGNRGTGGGETAPDVQNRRDVHVSTQGHPCPPTVGQHVDSGPDLRGRPRSPASTPVMTRMRERDRGFSNHIQGGEVALGVT